jgi:hypothetical protein
VAPLAADPSPERAGSRAGLISAPPREIFLFAARTLGWAAIFFAAWYFAAKPVSLTTSWIAARMLEWTAPVDAARVSWRDDRASFELEPAASIVYGHRLPADMVVDMDVNTMKQSYGLPFFLALLAAARPRRFASKAAIGLAILTILAADGIACEVAIGLGMTQVAGGAMPFAPSAFIGTAYALGLQLGTLIFPCVVPVVLVVWFAGYRSAAAATPSRATPTPTA